LFVVGGLKQCIRSGLIRDDKRAFFDMVYLLLRESRKSEYESNDSRR
jgi:hypothetical protein